MGLKFHAYMDGLNAVKARLTRGCNRAEHAVAVQVRKDTTPFVPALEKSLSKRTTVDGNLVVYPGPYARFLYYGKLMVDPNTGSAYAPKGGTKVVTDRNLVFTRAVHQQAQDHWFEASKAQNMEKWLRTADKAVKKYGTD